MDEVVERRRGIRVFFPQDFHADRERLLPCLPRRRLVAQAVKQRAELINRRRGRRGLCSWSSLRIASAC